MDHLPRSSPAADFALRTLIVVLTLGLTITFAVAHAVRQAGREQMTFHAAFVVDHLISPRLTEGAAPGTVLDEVRMLDPQVTGLVLLDDAGELRAASTGAAPPESATRDEVPLGDGAVIAVEQDGSAVAATTALLTRQIAAIVLGGLALLWLAVVPLARRLGHRLTTQFEELQEQGVELARLLAGEQKTVRRLREYDRLREQFLTSISHELRTPLTIVSGSLHTLVTRPDAIDDALRAQLLDRARHHAIRLDALVEDLLTLAGDGSEAAHDHDLVHVPTAVAAARRDLPSCRVDLDLDVAELWTDRLGFVQTLSALLDNAARHGPSDEPVVVRTRRRGPGVEVVVEDQGDGIPVEARADAFEPFWQGELRDAHSPGTGIGLALVAARAAAHGGRAWADERPGGGARVHVELPDALTPATCSAEHAVPVGRPRRPTDRPA